MHRHSFVGQGEALEMAYLDVRPEQPNGETIVLLHGKSFCAGAWEGSIRRLMAAGYRVIAPDQIGFCKSTKPARYQYGLHSLAANTEGLLKALGIDRPIVLGHSMGGMLAMRYAVQYPDALSKLVLINPLGLEDWRARGVPNATIDQLYAGELKTSRDSIKNHQQTAYYGGIWRPDYDRWVDMLASMYTGPGREIVAWHQALTSDMLFNQPVLYDLGRITAPTLLFVGEKDTTALGAGRASKEVAATLADYRRLGPDVAARIPGARLVSYPEYAHSPHVEAPDRFHQELLRLLRD